MPCLTELPWNWAFTRARSECVGPVERKWAELLERAAPEIEISGFVAAHVCLFLADTKSTHLVLKEIRLGADFAVDLVVPSEQGSVGVSYELVELERPDTPAFTKSGDSSARLNHAIGQVVVWKTWLARNVTEMRALFPAPAQVGPGYEVAFSYTIVIGRRSDSPEFTANRNALAETTGIRIRSFDWLSDRLRSASGPGFGTITPSAEARLLTYDVASRLKNPFYIALGDAQWRKLRRQMRPHPHLVPVNAQTIAEAQEYNMTAYNRLKDYCQLHPADTEQALRESKRMYLADLERFGG